MYIKKFYSFVNEDTNNTLIDLKTYLTSLSNSDYLINKKQILDMFTEIENIKTVSKSVNLEDIINFNKTPFEYNGKHYICDLKNYRFANQFTVTYVEGNETIVSLGVIEDEFKILVINSIKNIFDLRPLIRKEYPDYLGEWFKYNNFIVYFHLTSMNTVTINYKRFNAVDFNVGMEYKWNGKQYMENDKIIKLCFNALKRTRL